jgi:hypothetical protein
VSDAELGNAIEETRSSGDPFSLGGRAFRMLSFGGSTQTIVNCQWPMRERESAISSRAIAADLRERDRAIESASPGTGTGGRGVEWGSREFTGVRGG